MPPLPCPIVDALFVMAAKLKGNFCFGLPLISITAHLVGVKSSVILLLCQLSFRGGKEIQEAFRARLDTCLRLSSIDEVVSRRCKLRTDR